MNENQNAVVAKVKKREQEMAHAFEQLPGTEMVEKRAQNVKHYDLGGGRYQMVVYPEQVHYQEDSTWVEIDNTLVEEIQDDGRAILRNRANPLKVEFAQDADDEKLVRMVVDGKELSWSLDNEDRDRRIYQTQEIRKTINVQRALEEAVLQKEAAETVQTADALQGKSIMQEEAALKRAAMIEDGERTLARIAKRCVAKKSIMPKRLNAQEKRGEVVKAHAEARYEDVASGMSVVYRLEGGRFKEDIVLRDNAAIHKAALRLPDTYNYILNENGSVAVMEKDGAETPFTFTAPVAWDAKNAELPVRVELEKQDGYTRMRYAIAQDELNTAVFPVTIDPMVDTKNDLSRATFKKGEAIAATTGNLKSGKSGSNSWATALKLNNINWDGMKSSDTVTAAYLALTDRTGKSANYVGAYRVLEGWNQNTVNWDTLKCDEVGKAENERIDPVLLDCVKGAKKKGQSIKLNITRAYRTWKQENKNEGILLCQPHVMTKSNYMEFSAPKFYVNYMSHAGVAGWWQYESQGVGRTGTASVDIFNGNLVHTHKDMQMGGNRMPIGVAHYYNSCLSAPNAGTTDTETDPKKNNDYHCGRGFKLSAQQCIDLRKAGGSWFWVWTDGSGLEHWFKKLANGKSSKDLEGMELKLVYNAKTSKKLEHITITDKSHTVLTFKRRTDGKHAQWRNYWLIEVKDSIRRKSGVYNTNTYVNKLQGDIVDIAENRVVEYGYDAWGIQVE